MYAEDFEYASEKLSDYNMMICKFDSSLGLETLSSGADLTFYSAKPSMSNRFLLYGNAYESAYTSTFQICKHPDKTTNLYLSPFEVSSIQRWLCRKDKFHPFRIDQKNYTDFYWMGTFTCKQIEIPGGICGLELTLTTDAPYAYLNELELHYTVKSGESFTIYDSSDETGFICPDIRVTFANGGDFVLSNDMDRRTTRINKCLPGETIALNGTSKLISSDINNNSSMIHNLPSDFNYYFPKIINSYDMATNTFTSNLDIDITIKYSPIRKIGF